MRASNRARSPQRLRVRLADCADLETLSLELQKMLAHLQDHGVHSVSACSLYLEARDASGGIMSIHDEDGRPVETLDLSGAAPKSR